MGMRLNVATADDVASVWPAARASGLFESPEELRCFWERAPWRVLVSTRGEAAVVDRWRSHLDILAVKALWCSTVRIPDHLRTIGRIAVNHDLGRLLSPLVPEELSSAYERAGMRIHERILTLRLTDPAVPIRGKVAAVRQGGEDDKAHVLAVDRESFDEFWRYDPETLGSYLATERLAVAEEEGTVIGYTLCTVNGGVGTLGRLAVLPEKRSLGYGRQLLSEAVGWMARRGARSVTLCTQRHNHESRMLYASAGFKELSGTLVFLVSDPLE